MRTSLEELRLEAEGCHRCPLAQSRCSVVFGEGPLTAEIMFIGEGPGEAEDLSGRPFVGRSGKLLSTLILQEVGVPREMVYIANTVKCRPPNNRNPTELEVESCEGFLTRQISIVQPKVLVTLGAVATKALLRRKEAIGKLRSLVYSYHEIPLIPTYHPAAALRGGGGQILAAMRADLALAKLVLAGTE